MKQPSYSSADLSNLEGIYAMPDADSALQMCAQTLTDVLLERHQEMLKQQNSCHGQPQGERCFAEVVGFLPASLGSDSAWRYFIDHGLQACTQQLGLAAQQAMGCLINRGDGGDVTSAVSHAHMEGFLRVLSKS